MFITENLRSVEYDVSDILKGGMTLYGGAVKY